MNDMITPNGQIPSENMNMKMPAAITTVIPTYCRPKLLERAIKSVLNQTYPHLRVCIYDNASGDETADIVAELARKDSRVTYYCHSENIGAIGNFNFGVKEVRTPFFSVLSDDDILLPDFYEIALKGLNKYPDAAFSATEVICMKPDGSFGIAANSTWKNDYYRPPAGLLAMFEDGRHPPTMTGVLFRSIVIEHIGFFDEAVGGPCDYDYMQRIAAHFPFVLSNVPGGIYVMHSSSASSTAGLGLVWPGWLKMIHNLTDDNRIPMPIREKFRLYSMKELKMKVFLCGMQSIKYKKYEDTYKAASVLYHHFSAKFLASVIYLTAKACEHASWLQTILVHIINLYRRLNLYLGKSSIPNVEKYSSYLN